MAMNAQGVQIHRLSSSADANSSAATAMRISGTAIEWPAGTVAGEGFVNCGFTTAMWVQLSSKSTELHRIKAVGATNIDIFSTFLTTDASTNLVAYGYASTLIGEITDFTGPGGAAAIIDVTSIQSTAKEKLVGLRDEGSLSLTLNFNATDAGQTKLISDRAGRTQRMYTIVFTDKTSAAAAYPSWCYFKGYAMQYSLSGGVDNKITANAVIEIDGPVIYSTAV